MVNTVFKSPTEVLVQWKHASPAIQNLSVLVETSPDGVTFERRLTVTNTYCCTLAGKPFVAIRLTYNGEQQETVPYLVGTLPPADQRRIIELRRQQQLKATVGGLPGYLLKRRVGPVCPLCTVGSVACVACLGAKVTGGYYPMIPYDVTVFNHSLFKQHGLKSVAKVDTKNTLVGGLYGPVVEPNDVWLNKFTGEYYLLGDLEINSFRGVPYAYKAINMSLLQPNHVIYKIKR